MPLKKGEKAEQVGILPKGYWGLGASINFLKWDWGTGSESATKGGLGALIGTTFSKNGRVELGYDYVGKWGDEKESYTSLMVGWQFN
jgi:hypothetical protein